jgi:hypothetical protein
MLCGKKSHPTEFFHLSLKAVALACAASVMFANATPAHEWYPYQCCSGGDCYSISKTDLEALPDGSWEVKATGEIFAGPNGGNSMRKVKFSPDGQYHRCSFNHDRKASSICLFIPLPFGS